MKGNCLYSSELCSGCYSTTFIVTKYFHAYIREFPEAILFINAASLKGSQNLFLRIKFSLLLLIYFL